MKKQNSIDCEICGAPNARIRRVTRTYGTGKDLLMIERVPVVSCPSCGESYLTADTLHEIEHIRSHRRGRTRERSVDVATFATR
jgi:YgiT-type zinc finger domain-containing protein